MNNRRFVLFLVVFGLFVSLSVVLYGCATSAFIGYKMSPDYPRNADHSLHIAGLHQKVEVYYDQAGIPHIYAQDIHDLLIATGFVQARDRFFQMDILRRIAKGRMSEFVGEQPFSGSDTIHFDLAMRGWGMEELAERDIESMSAEARALLDAYVSGVNMAVSMYKPLEYRLLRVEPQPWTALDTMAVGRLIAWSITHNWTQEATRLLLALFGSPKQAEQIYSSNPWPNSASIAATPEQEKFSLPPSFVSELEDVFDAIIKVRPKDATARNDNTAFAGVPFFSGASNAWAVAGELSASGKPILAGDPHLSHTVPSLMYEQHLHWANNDIIGAAVPGIPFVVAGTNGKVAWSITSTVADIVDLCIEKQNPNDSSLVLAPNENWEKIQERDVTIKVRDGKSFEERHFKIRYTRNGPLFNDMYPDVLPKWAPLVSVRTDRNPISKSIFALAKLASVSTVSELHDAVKDLAAPINTWVAADTSGTIGIFVAGRIPVRRHHRGTFPIPGWLKKYDWQEFIPYSKLPFATATGKAMFANGNNLTEMPGNSEYFVNIDAAAPYRLHRILDLLTNHAPHNLNTMKQIQTDLFLLRAKELMPHILADLKTAKSGMDDMQKKALALLEKWDFYALGESAEPLIFFALYRFAAMDALRNKLSKPAFEFVITRRYTPNFIDLAMQGNENPLWDDPNTPQKETRRDVLTKAFKEAIEWLESKYGKDVSAWRWDRAHYINIQHPFGGKKKLASYLNMPKVGLGGGMDSIWKTHFEFGAEHEPFRIKAGPVWRIVVNMADPAHGVFVVDTGESGWPGSPHYGDQFKLWAKGKYVPITMDWNEIKSSKAGKWTLIPETKNKN